MFVGQPNIWTFAVVMLYAVTILAEGIRWLMQKERIGTVVDQVSNQGVGLAILRVFDAASHRLVASHVTNERGKFYFWLKRGTHRLSITHTGYRQIDDAQFTTHTDAAIVQRFGLEHGPA